MPYSNSHASPGNRSKMMAGKGEPPGDPLEVSWMGGFTGMDGDTPPALSSAASTSEPQVLPPGERSHG